MPEAAFPLDFRLGTAIQLKPQDPVQDVLPIAVLENESQQTGALLILASKLQAGELNPLLGVEESLGTEKV